MFKIYGIIGTIFVFLSVLGFTIAHYNIVALLPNALPAYFFPLSVANEIQLVHGLALIFVGSLTLVLRKCPFLYSSGIFFIIGLILNAEGMFTWSPGVVYAGFIFFLIGWIVLLVAIAGARVKEHFNQ